MSSRAASRLAHLGFPNLYIYKPAKVEWLAYWLPWEGTAKSRMVGSLARRNPPTCRLGERCGDAVRLLPPGEDTCIVVDEHSVVQGVLTRERMVANSDASVDAVMERGPLTIRPSERLDRFAQRLERANVGSAAVTTPDGRLWGLLSRSDAESVLRDRERTRVDATA